MKSVFADVNCQYYNELGRIYLILSTCRFLATGQVAARTKDTNLEPSTITFRHKDPGRLMRLQNFCCAEAICAIQYSEFKFIEYISPSTPLIVF